MMITRRIFLKILYTFGLLTAGFKKIALATTSRVRAVGKGNIPAGTSDRLGIDPNGISHVFTASNGTSEENMLEVVEKMGGISRLIGETDIVVLKPNAQWWNQGMTNTDAMKAFIEIILGMDRFSGEIIIAENHHKYPPNSRGWTTEERNGRFNLNELVSFFSDRGHQNVTKYHWRDAGPNPKPLQGDDHGGGKIVAGPQDGDGYVWRKDIQYIAPNGNVCLMTYPIFTSSYSGIRIDLKNGAWKNGTYLKDRKVNFINFSALNHHSRFSGLTGSIKNLMGVVDMTCGLQGPEPKDTYNVHFVGVDSYVRVNYWLKRRWGLKLAKQFVRKIAYKNFEYTGGALGKFLTSVCLPDLNIITADWVGWGSRTNTTMSSHPRMILASKDPVALDIVSGRDVLYASTPVEETWYRDMNNPDDKNGPAFKFIHECHKQGVGNIDPEKIKVI